MEMISVSSLGSFDLPDEFFFFCCASFEDRCLIVPSHIKKNSVISSFVFQFSEFSKFSNNNLEKLNKILSPISIKKLSNSRSLHTADVFHGCFKELFERQDKVDIVVDITTFTREAILIILYLAYHFKGNLNSCYFLYNSSSSMDYNWLSFKIKEFRSVVGFSGVMLPTKKMHLTVILGFEVDRARSIIDKYEPSLLTIARGAEQCSINSEYCERNRNFVDQLNSFYLDKPNNITISVVDAFVAKQNLQVYLEKYRDYNNVIAPLNTKISTVGAGLLSLENPEIQICYTQMELYNFSSYSMPSDEIYIIKLF